MKNQPLISRLAESAALLLMWPFALVISTCCLIVSITADIANRVAEVWK